MDTATQPQPGSVADWTNQLRQRARSREEVHARAFNLIAGITSTATDNEVAVSLIRNVVIAADQVADECR